MKEARLLETQNNGFTFTNVVRGPLNEGDRHWGMRSNKNLRKRLEARK